MASLYPPVNDNVLIPSTNRFARSWVLFFTQLFTQGTGGGFAPNDAQYVLGATDTAALPNSRVVTDTATVAWDLATANQAKADVPDGAITYAKLQNETADTLLGRGTSGTGPPQEITIGSGLTLSGTTLSAVAPTQYMVVTVGGLVSTVGLQPCVVAWTAPVS